MRKHEWRERSEEGEVQFFRATKHGRQWTLQTKLKGDEFWNRHDPLTRDDVLIIRAMLERKYQRNRAPYEDLNGIDKWLQEDLLKSPKKAKPALEPKPPRKSAAKKEPLSDDLEQ
ncbi:MAG: hypothetical protein KDN22_06125 [Verrucomicrobiae bacterium]|nr:hypothetical protein [Verrucomicrobiae bacterium]